MPSDHIALGLHRWNHDRMSMACEIARARPPKLGFRCQGRHEDQGVDKRNQTYVTASTGTTRPE